MNETEKLYALLESIQRHHSNIAQTLHNVGLKGILHWYHCARAVQIQSRIQEIKNDTKVS